VVGILRTTKMRTIELWQSDHGEKRSGAEQRSEREVYAATTLFKRGRRGCGSSSNGLHQSTIGESYPATVATGGGIPEGGWLVGKSPPNPGSRVATRRKAH
jgi:hypothetical protein